MLTWAVCLAWTLKANMSMSTVRKRLGPLPFLFRSKVEKIWKGRLNLNPSPSSSMKRQNITGCYQQTFENKQFVDTTQKYFALLPQVNFFANNLNFHLSWRWWDPMQAIFLNIFYFNSYFEQIILVQCALLPDNKRDGASFVRVWNMSIIQLCF